LALLLTGVVFVGPRVVDEPYLDWIYLAVSGGLVAAGTAFTLASFRHASVRAREQSVHPDSATHAEPARRQTNTLLRIVVGAGTVAANVAALYASGHPNILEWVLAALVGALILLIRYRAMHPTRNPTHS
jgi:multisubunit Na+/H+ antiporter MnhB subunit